MRSSRMPPLTLNVLARQVTPPSSTESDSFVVATAMYSQNYRSDMLRRRKAVERYKKKKANRYVAVVWVVGG